MQSLAGLLLDLAGNLLPAREPALSELGRSLTSRVRAISDAAGDAHHRRRVLVQDLADLLVTADPGTPVLIILEDLHWADELSLDVLGHLAGRSRPGRCWSRAPTAAMSCIPGCPCATCGPGCWASG